MDQRGGRVIWECGTFLWCLIDFRNLIKSGQRGILPFIFGLDLFFSLVLASARGSPLWRTHLPQPNDLAN